MCLRFEPHHKEKTRKSPSINKQKKRKNHESFSVVTSDLWSLFIWKSLKRTVREANTVRGRGRRAGIWLLLPSSPIKYTTHPLPFQSFNAHYKLQTNVWRLFHHPSNNINSSLILICRTNKFSQITCKHTYSELWLKIDIYVIKRTDCATFIYHWRCFLPSMCA